MQEKEVCRGQLRYEELCRSYSLQHGRVLSKGLETRSDLSVSRMLSLLFRKCLKKCMTDSEEKRRLLQWSPRDSGGLD